ncbi:hypothetical protein [Microvirga sesbaniae]|uniref:hypothetical protein n=1 Tax=Microvirga sesbaniae TaxID=681392 RepID=UPI0021C63DD1|nr:hypothetical protein [Microvirga sp. HBU67692]
MKARKIAKLGRQRAKGEREPNGRLSRAVKAELDARSPNEVKRLRDAALLGMRDPLWGTEIGRLFLGNRIDARHYEAGKRWANLVESWRRDQGLAALAPRSGLAALPIGARGPDRSQDPTAAARSRRLADALSDARDALDAAGFLESRIVRDCCEQNAPVVGLSEIRRLRDGLDALAEHWRISSA